MTSSSLAAASVFALLTVFMGGSSLLAAEPTRTVFIVDGVPREALICAPALGKASAAPLIFGFHGHGGNMNNAMRSFGYEKLWPEAVVVYPQGLKTPGRLTDPQGLKAGWQSTPGAVGDRDLKFFDVMLKELRAKFKVDDQRLYSTGHSNGGGFTYLLWAERGDLFAAFAPSSSVAPTLMSKLKPKPVLHVAGQNDPLVKFAWQEMTMTALRKTNQCSEGQPWESVPGCTLYPSSVGAPLVTLIHPGNHTFLAAAPAAIVRFFKAQVKQ
jgi:polyhydroxybutyrate depolymerase